MKHCYDFETKYQMTRCYIFEPMPEIELLKLGSPFGGRPFLGSPPS